MSNRRKFINPRYFLNETMEREAPKPVAEEERVNDAGTNKKVLYAAAKRQIEEVLNTLWDDLDAGGVPDAQAELNKLMAQVQKDMDAGFVGEPT